PFRPLVSKEEWVITMDGGDDIAIRRRAEVPEFVETIVTAGPDKDGTVGIARPDLPNCLCIDRVHDGGRCGAIRLVQQFEGDGGRAACVVRGHLSPDSIKLIR